MWYTAFFSPDTNVNTMVVPGFVAEVRTTFRRARRIRDAVPRVLRSAATMAMWAHVECRAERAVPKPNSSRKDALCSNSSRLALCHYWVAFAVFLPAVAAGRLADADAQPAAGAARRLRRLLRLGDSARHRDGLCGHHILHHGFRLCRGGDEPRAVLFAASTAAWIGFVNLPGRHGHGGRRHPLRRQASVLYTFYPPLLASGWYYGGAFLLIGGSMIWVVLMVVNMAAWKRDNPGRPVPLAMFAITATAILWAWAASRRRARTRRHSAAAGLRLERSDRRRTRAHAVLGDAACDRLFLADAGLYRLLHAGAASGRRAALQRHDGAAYLHHVPRVLAARRDAPSFRLIPSTDRASSSSSPFSPFWSRCRRCSPSSRSAPAWRSPGGVRGGRGLLGWIAALPWHEPMVLAVGLSLVMLGLGGFGGLINMSYAMNSMIHNTSWVTAHFHLIFGGAVVIMYFAIAYEMWPRITGKPLRSKASGALAALAVVLGHADHHDSLAHRRADGTTAAGRDIRLYQSADRAHGPARHHLGNRRPDPADLGDPFDRHPRPLAFRRTDVSKQPLRYALAVNPPARVPPSLNGFALWNTIVLVLMIVAYGYPIGQFFVLKQHTVPAVEVTGQLNPDGATMMVRDQGPFRLDNPWPRIGWWSDRRAGQRFVRAGFCRACAIPAERTRRSIPGTRSAARIGITADSGPAGEPQPPLRTPTRIAWTQRHTCASCSGQRSKTAPWSRSIAAPATARAASAHPASSPPLPEWMRWSSTNSLTTIARASACGA